MLTKSVFTCKHQQAWHLPQTLNATLPMQEKKMNEKGFNLDRFRHLVRSREMYTRYVTAQAEQVKRASDANAGAAP